MLYPVKNFISIISGIFCGFIFTIFYELFLKIYSVKFAYKIIFILDQIIYSVIIFTPILIITLFVVHHLFCLHLNSNFELARKGFKRYIIVLRPLSFIKTTRKKQCSRSKTALIFLRQFIDAVFTSAEQFINKDSIFQTTTWLLNKNRKELLKNLGFKIVKINHPLIHKFIVSIISLIACKRFSIIDEIIGSDFYEITWTHEEVNKLRNYLKN